MSATARHHQWKAFLNLFTESNRGRPTRLGTFENGNDLWLEAGLGFEGLDMDDRDEFPSVQIVLEGYQRVVDNVREIVFRLGRGEEDGVDIVDLDGDTTVLRFETEAEK